MIVIPALLAPVTVYGNPWSLCWFCHVTLIVTWVGFLLGDLRLLSGVTAASLSINVGWTLDAISSMTGHGVTGATGFLLDDQIPLTQRLANWFHTIHPVAMVILLRRYGYHSLGGWFGIAQITIVVLSLRLADTLGWLDQAPADLNFMHGGPSAGLPVWLDGWTLSFFTIVYMGLALILPAHLTLRRLCPPIAPRAEAAANAMMDSSSP